MAAWCVATLQGVLADLLFFMDGREVSSDVLSTLIHQLQIVYRELAVAEALGDISTSSALKLVGLALESLEGLEDGSRAMLETVYTSPTMHKGVVGISRYFNVSNLWH